MSLAVQTRPWLGAVAQPLVQEDTVCCGATKLMLHTRESPHTATKTSTAKIIPTYTHTYLCACSVVSDSLRPHGL